MRQSDWWGHLRVDNAMSFHMGHKHLRRFPGGRSDEDGCAKAKQSDGDGDLQDCDDMEASCGGGGMDVDGLM